MTVRVETGNSLPWRTCNHRRGCVPPHPSSPGRASCRGGKQSFADEVQIREREHRESAGGILRQSAIAHLREAPKALDDMERMLDAGTDPRACPIDDPPTLGQRCARVCPAIDPIAHAAVLKDPPLRLTPIRPV